MKLTPSPVITRKKYRVPVMLSRFVCALLDFCASMFPAKSGKTGTFFADFNWYVLYIVWEILHPII